MSKEQIREAAKQYAEIYIFDLDIKHEELATLCYQTTGVRLIDERSTWQIWSERPDVEKFQNVFFARLAQFQLHIRNITTKSDKFSHDRALGFLREFLNRGLNFTVSPDAAGLYEVQSISPPIWEKLQSKLTPGATSPSAKEYWLSQGTNMAIERFRSIIKAIIVRESDYLNKAHESDKKAERGGKNADVHRACSNEYSARGLELSWVMELMPTLEEREAWLSQQGVEKPVYTITDFFDGLRELVDEAREWWHRETSAVKNKELLKRYYPDNKYGASDEMIVNMYLKETKK